MKDFKYEIMVDFDTLEYAGVFNKQKVSEPRANAIFRYSVEKPYERISATRIRTGYVGFCEYINFDGESLTGWNYVEEKDNNHQIGVWIIQYV